jgi:hypothetical protein
MTIKTIRPAARGLRPGIATRGLGENQERRIQPSARLARVVRPAAHEVSGRSGRAQTLETEMRTVAVIAVMVALAGCARPGSALSPRRSRQEPSCHRMSSRSRRASTRASAVTSSSRAGAFRMRTSRRGPRWRSRTCPRRVTVPTVGGHIRAAAAARGTRRRRPTRSSTRGRATTALSGRDSTTPGSAFRACPVSAGASWPSGARLARSCESVDSWRLNSWAPGADFHRLRGDASRLVEDLELAAPDGGDDGPRAEAES